MSFQDDMAYAIENYNSLLGCVRCRAERAREAMPPGGMRFVANVICLIEKPPHTCKPTTEGS